MKTVRVLIAAGGTGGHIYPGLTIAEELKRRFCQVEIVFVGTEYGLEKDIIPRAGYPLELISVQYFRRALSLESIKTGIVALRGLRQSFALIREFEPDIVVGTGGYVAGPLLLAAALRKVPTLIQEQNALPGVTNRILGRFAQCIALGYQEASRYFPQNRVIVTGNPIRREITSIKRAEALERLQLDPARRTIIVFGGSQGGLSINRAMRELAPRFNQLDSLQVIHQTGKRSYEDMAKEVLGRTGVSVSNQLPEMAVDGCIRMVPYIYDMPAALAAADLVVGRAGALSLAEITARGLPAILIPFPYAAENHQEKNARVLERAGAARVLLDADVNADSLGDLILSLLDNPRQLKSMAVASRSLGRVDATRAIVDQIEALTAPM